MSLKETAAGKTSSSSTGPGVGRMTTTSLSLPLTENYSGELDEEAFNDMLHMDIKLKSSLTKSTTLDLRRRLEKMKKYMRQCEISPKPGINASILAKMRTTIAAVEASGELPFDRWLRVKRELQATSLMQRINQKLERRGRWMKKIERLESQKIEEASAIEDDERIRLWAQICRKHLVKAAKTTSQNISTKISYARRAASLCAKEQHKSRVKLKKTETRDIASRSKKAMKEMLQFWKRNEKEERDLRKRAEKEAAERRRQEEEEREARRQEKKLYFLLTQTELYSHFIARKDPLSNNSTNAAVDGTVNRKPTLAVGTDFADLDDATISEQARLMAVGAVAAEREKLRKFDAESDTHRKEAGGKVSTLGQDFDLTSPSTLTNAQLEVRQPRMLQCQLKSYQLKGLNWLANLYEQGINGILADEMGLGKTVQAISLMAHLAETHNIWGPFVVIAPASTLHNWQQELAKFVPTLRALPYWGNVKDRTTLRRFWGTKRLYTKDSPFHVLITSYQLVVSDEKYFQKIKWQYMVLDEAQAIKSSSSVRWKTLLSFSCRNRLLLTGTPIQNSMQELWALLHFIMPGLFDSHDEFSDWFSKDIENHAVAAEARSGASTLSPHQLQRLHVILKPFMLRRVKKDVEDELGAKIEYDVDCSLTARQRTLYRAIRDKLPVAELVAMSTSTNAGINSNADTLMNIVMQFRKVCNHPELFERTDITSPFVLHHLDTIRPTYGSTGNGYVIGPLSNPLSLRIPRLVIDQSQSEASKKLLDFDASIYHGSHVNGCFDDPNDPFAVTNFSSFINRGDIPMLLRGGPLQLTKTAIERKSAFFNTFQNYLEFPQDTTINKCDLLFDDANSIVSDSVRYLIKSCSSMYIPKAVAGPISLVVEDINYIMKSKIDRSTTEALPAICPCLEFHEQDETSGRHILTPNLAKLVTDTGKMMALDKLLAELKVGGHRVLIYNQMTKMIDLMEEYLHYKGYSYIRLDGSSKIADRRDLVADWQSCPDIFVFLLSTRAGGLGINLTAADTVIFYDSDWNPTVDQQAMDRAHRLGQTKQVTVYRLITRNSIEERMRQRAKQKDEIHKVVIAGGEFRQYDPTASKPNQKDIVALLLDEQDGNGIVHNNNHDDGEKRPDEMASKKIRLS